MINFNGSSGAQQPTKLFSLEVAMIITSETKVFFSSCELRVGKVYNECWVGMIISIAGYSGGGPLSIHNELP